MAPQPSELPNVLLVVFDTARADAFSPYAADRHTVTVQQLATRGFAYPKAMAPSCWTVPSHAAMFLGAPPRSVGICRVSKGNGKLCAPVISEQRDRYLPEVLRRNGFETRGVSANAWISKANGFSVGFDHFHELTGNRASKMHDAGLRMKLSWYLDALQARADDGAQAIDRLLQEWIAAAPRKPFFWFVNLVECHSPYLPAKPFNDLGVLQRLAAARDNRSLTLMGVLRAIATGETPSPRALERMRRLYDQSVVLMDKWLARVLEALDEEGVLDETVVVVTSDHGENFGECGLIGHGGSLDDRLLWVPLVVAGPGVLPAPEGVVSLDTLPRMLADILKIDHPWESSGPPGVAVAQYDGPVDLEDPSADFLLKLKTTPERIRRLTQRHTCATDGRLKLLRTDDGSWLYDLESDALELAPRPVDAYPPGATASLRQALDQAAHDERDATVDGELPEMTADLEARMRLLGYL